MALFRADANGDIIQFFSTYQSEQQNGGNVPPGTAYSLQFDEQTNPGIVSAYGANSAAFRMDGGTLTDDGVPVTINPPQQFYAAFQNAAAMLAKANSGDPHSWTTEEVDRLVAVAFRAAGLG